MIIYLRDYFFFPIASLPYPTYRCTAYASNVNGICQQCRWHTPAMSMAYASNVDGICQQRRRQMSRMLRCLAR